MDSDLWISRLAAAKRHQSLQRHQNPQLDRLGIDDFEMEEEARLDFSCPYCYEDHDVTSLCSHLEVEHAFESKAAFQEQDFVIMLGGKVIFVQYKKHSAIGLGLDFLEYHRLPKYSPNKIGQLKGQGPI